MQGGGGLTKLFFVVNPLAYALLFKTIKTNKLKQ